jgi:hypothetical protein
MSGSELRGNKMSDGEMSDEVAVLEQRHDQAALLTLVELDPPMVVDGAWLHDCYVSGDIKFSGEMREVCPECEGVHLQLVLRQDFVKRAHMFCPECTRCFDARYADGSAALSLI